MSNIVPLEMKRKEVEIIRIKASSAELEFKIMERMDEIERIKENIKLQKARVEELEKELETHRK